MAISGHIALVPHASSPPSPTAYQELFLKGIVLSFNCRSALLFSHWSLPWNQHILSQHDTSNTRVFWLWCPSSRAAFTTVGPATAPNPALDSTQKWQLFTSFSIGKGNIPMYTICLQNLKWPIRHYSSFFIVKGVNYTKSSFTLERITGRSQTAKFLKYYWCSEPLNLYRLYLTPP